MSNKKERLSNKAEQLFCFKCGKEIPSNHKMEPLGDGKYIGRCLHKSKGGCQRKTYFVNKEGSKGEIIDGNDLSTASTNSTTSTGSTTSTDKGKDHLIMGLLSKERKPYKSVGRGIHNGVFYIGTVFDYGKKQLDAVVTSDRKIYVDWGKDEYNQITGEFCLNYRFPLFSDCMDYWWSNDSIKKWFSKNYVVDLKELFAKIVSLNKQYMIYEDERIHAYTALDIMRSYFFPLFSANSRTYHHADPGSGKTNQLMIYRALSFNPISSADFSSASIYRIIESTGGTILIDDFDLLPEEQKNAIIQHIRVNYKKFKTIRADGNRKNRPYAYKSYSHLVFNNVFGLGYDKVTPERLITVRLLKHKDARDRTVEPDDDIWSSVRDDLYVMALQYWKEIRESYNNLKIGDLNSRESEVIKPILAIAKIINNNLYEDILDWYKELNKQEKLRDLTDDWEYYLLKGLWEIVRDKSDKEKVTVFVKDLAKVITDNVSDPGSENYKKTFYKICSFVGVRLKGYVLFKGGQTNGITRYEIYREGVHQILDAKGLLEIVDPVDTVEGETPNDIKQKNLYQINDIRNIQAFCNTTKNKDGFTTEKSIVAFIKNRLNKKDPKSYYQHFLQEGILTYYSGKGVTFTGGA